jgi:SAM-dependent methyltransferase
VSPEPYYRRDLALVHHLGFGFHADASAPGILALLEPVRAAGGVVLELGCGSGLLTRHLVDAGHRVIATDASPAMLALTRENVPKVEDVRQVVLPDDPLPEADAVVSTGHVLSYLPDEDALERALVAVARALRPGGVVALDLEDLRWAEVRRDAPAGARQDDDWAVIHEWEIPTPTRFVRRITTFLPNDDGSWRRDQEVHENVLIDTADVPRLLAEHGVEAERRWSFGDETAPEGLAVIVGRKARS